MLESNPNETHISVIPRVSVDSKHLSTEGAPCDFDEGAKRTSLFSFKPKKIRLGKDHELFEDGDVHRHMYLQNLTTSVADEDAPHAKVGVFCCHISGCSQLLESLEEYEHHYSALHRHVCSTCRRCLPSARLLDIHILEWHDSLFQIMAQKQNMYQCLVEGCDLKFSSSAQRKEHLIQTHSYPADFRFDKPKKAKRIKEKGKGAPEQKDAGGMEVGVDGAEEPVVAAANLSKSGEEAMDCSHPPVEDAEELQLKPADPQTTARQQLRHASRVPHSICFGHGSVRGFRGQRRKK